MTNPFVGEWTTAHANSKKKSFSASFLFVEDAEGHLRVIPSVKGYVVDAAVAKMLSYREVEITSTVRVAMGLTFKTICVFKLTSAEEFEGTMKLPAKPIIPLIGHLRVPEENTLPPRITRPPATGPSKLPMKQENLPFTVVEEKTTKIPVKPVIGAPTGLISPGSEESEPLWDLGDAPDLVKPTASFKNTEVEEKQPGTTNPFLDSSAV